MESPGWGVGGEGDTGQINDERREKGSRDQKGDRRAREDRGKV